MQVNIPAHVFSTRSQDNEVPMLDVLLLLVVKYVYHAKSYWMIPKQWWIALPESGQSACATVKVDGTGTFGGEPALVLKSFSNGEIIYAEPS